MAAPQTPHEPGDTPTPGEARRQGLRRSRWVAAGVAVGSAAFLTGVIAGLNGVDGNSSDGPQISSVLPGGVQQVPQYGDNARGDDGGYEVDDDLGSARPFDPQAGTSQQAPSFDPSSGSASQPGPQAGPQTRSGGS